MRRRTAVIAIAMLGTLVSGPATAVADNRPSGDLEAMLARQQQIHQTTDKIWTRVESRSETGFAGIRQENDATSYTVYWKGTPPPWVRATMDAGSGPPGRIVQAAHSRTELRAAARSLVLQGLDSGDTLASVSLDVDGSGLQLEVLSDGSGVPDGNAVQRNLRDKLDIPVEVSITKGRPKLTSRDNDLPPWYAGGAGDRRGEQHNICSLSFAVRLSSGAVRILSAAHCAGGGGQLVEDGALQDIGDVSVQDNDLDTELIDPASTTPGYGHVFTGDWNGTASVPVTGSAYNNEGDYVCTSGSMSGTHCNIRVLRLDYYPGIEGYPGPYVLARRMTENAVAVVEGDSGGAIYDPTSGGAIAKGTISGVVAIWQCSGGMRFNQTVKCGRDVFYHSHMAVLQRWNANTITAD